MAGNQGLHSAENGKKGGRPRSEATILREVLIRKIEENAEPIAEALLKKGMAGDVQALRELLDRGLGKPQQSVDHTTAGKELPTPILNIDALRHNDGDKENRPA